GGGPRGDSSQQQSLAHLSCQRSLEFKGKERRTLEWTQLPSLKVARCFLGAAFDPHGALVAIGGGDGMYIDASTFQSTEVLHPGSKSWKPGPSMIERRCGLGCAAHVDGKLYAIGGYGGNMLYHSSAEVLDPGSDLWMPLPSMLRRRTGLGLAWGPHGRLYAVGGTANGSIGHKTVERFDPREGKWTYCPSMTLGRAYCSAAFGASGHLYVVGGLSSPDGLIR
ncbi:unnamed protein product, partial [Choristocarpus tenellus]